MLANFRTSFSLGKLKLSLRLPRKYGRNPAEAGRGTVSEKNPGPPGTVRPLRSSHSRGLLDAMAQPHQGHAALRWRRDGATRITDDLVVEEPLEIRLDGRRYTATMRTPGEDRRLALGLLLTEGVIADLDDVEQLSVTTRCRENSTELVNLVDVTLFDGAAVPEVLFERSLISNASCGLCGKASVEALTSRTGTLPRTPLPGPELLLAMPDQMRAHQKIFTATGGLHAAALFDGHGALLVCFEDIGRHNATDKVIGWALENGLVPAHDPLTLLVSGRASFEIVQKAAMARIATLAAVSAVSSLAVELAASVQLNLVGFLRPNGFTVYQGRLPGEL